MSIQNWLIEEARLVLLRLLNEMSSYRANSSTLQDQLDKAWGISLSRDQVKTELYWLKDQGCVEIVAENASVIIVKLATRGQDVIENRTRVHGIKRPSA